MTSDLSTECDTLASLHKTLDMYEDLAISSDDFLNIDEDVVTCASHSIAETVAQKETSTSDCATSSYYTDDCGNEEDAISHSNVKDFVHQLDMYLMQSESCPESTVLSFRKFRNAFEKYLDRIKVRTQNTPKLYL